MSVIREAIGPAFTWRHSCVRDRAGRLKGVSIGVSAMPSLPLSVEGHAHRLIEEAVDKENLGSMYIWWMAWF